MVCDMRGIGKVLLRLNGGNRGRQLGMGRGKLDGQESVKQQREQQEGLREEGAEEQAEWEGEREETEEGLEEERWEQGESDPVGEEPRERRKEDVEVESGPFY